jgi:ubiquinone/menaquinone biosynthesis C-methylase UbiE
MAASSTFISASGEGYELLMGRWSRRLAEPFLDFCGWQDGESILDAGCGTGSLTFALAQRTKTANIEGIDFSSAYIEYATNYNHDPRIRFRVGDICALPYENAAFDRVMSLLVLHFVPRPEDAVAEMRRVARPGATVAAAVWDARGGFVANRIFFDTAATLDQKGSDRRARNYTRPMTRPGELASAWRTAGFIDIREAMLTIRMEFESFNDYWAPYVGKDIGTCTARTPARLGPCRLSGWRSGRPSVLRRDSVDGCRPCAWVSRGCGPRCSLDGPKSSSGRSTKFCPS